MKVLFYLFIFAATIAFVIGCGSGPLVIQGSVTAVDIDNHSLVIRDELPPHGELILSIAKADYGSVPHVGDRVRISYREADGKLNAIRIMALSGSEEKKETGH